MRVLAPNIPADRSRRHSPDNRRSHRIDAVLFEKVESLHREVNRRADEIKKGCERDIRKVDDRLRTMEKKMWSIFGALTVISFIVSIPGQAIIKGIFTEKQKPLTNLPQTTMIYSSQVS